MTLAVQQLLTLAAVILGAGATFAATALNERVKWRRGQDTRWDDKRLVAYSEYANSLKEFVQVVYRVAAAQGYSAVSQPIELADGVRAMAVAEADRTVKWENVLLLGSPEAVDAARAWHRVAWELGWVVREKSIDDAEFVRRYEEMGRRRNQFYACARTDLGVRSGVLPGGDQAWLPPAASGNDPIAS